MLCSLHGDCHPLRMLVCACKERTHAACMQLDTDLTQLRSPELATTFTLHFYARCLEAGLTWGVAREMLASLEQG